MNPLFIAALLNRLFGRRDKRPLPDRGQGRPEPADNKPAPARPGRKKDHSGRSTGSGS